MTFNIQAGGIYKLPFPFTDRSGRKARSALALNAPDTNGDVRFLFIDWVLALPDGLEDRLWAEIEDFDEEKQMHYLASFERKAQQIGMEKGIGKGQARLLNRLIQQRFGALPPELEARLQAAAPEQLETWALRLLTAGRLEDVFGAGGEPEQKPH